MSYAIRLVFESGRVRIIGPYASESGAYAALWSLDMCGIAKAQVIPA